MYLRRFLLLLLFPALIYAEQKNGFELNNSAIPPDEIYQGGPPRDGIPSIDQPQFLSVKRASYLTPSDRVLGISYNGIHKAYPIAILNWHEVVNDYFADQPVLVSFCPLCGTGVAYLLGKKGHFGVSGLLYNSDVLLYDRESESLWSQVLAKAISGPRKGEKLRMMAIHHTSWQAWQQRYPDTLVLSRDTGYSRDYQRDPYGHYLRSDGLFFPVKARSPLYHPKERVLGVEIDGHYRAYPFSELAKRGGLIEEMIEGKHLKVHFDELHQSGWIEDEKGNQLVSTTAFWFAWYGFHPQTSVYRVVEP